MDIHRCRFVDYTPHAITALAFSHASDPAAPASTGLRLAVGHSNGDIEIWNPRGNWTHELTLPGARGRSVEGLVWAHVAGENPRLFSIGGSTYITEWDLTTGYPRANLNCNASVVWCVASNVSGSRLAAGCDDGSVVIVSLAGGPGVLEFEFICQRQELRVLGIRWYDDETVICGCADGKVRMWTLGGENRGRISGCMKVDRLKTESTLVWSVACLPAKGQFVTGDSTGAVKFWDAKTHTLVQSFTTHDADVLCLAVDAAGTRVFSAGIDRRIHHFSYLESKTKRGTRWIHNDGRLLHLNDVRALQLFECHSHSLLVSGGVERSLIVQAADKFQHGPYKKILMDQQVSNIVTCVATELVAMFQDLTVKVWRVDGERHRLEAKIALADDDNITCASIGEFTPKETLLAVGTLNAVKIFALRCADKKLAVRKYRDASFDALVSGAKRVSVFGAGRLLVQSPDDQLLIFQVYDTTVALVHVLEALDPVRSELRAGFDHYNSIRAVALSHDNTRLAVARFNNTIDLVDIGNRVTPVRLATLSCGVHLMHFTLQDTLVVLGDDNKLVDLNTQQNGQPLMTAWSQRNSELLPAAFLRLDHKPQGMFVQDTKVWVYGTQWLCFFDFAVNLDPSKSGAKSRKRVRDDLSINEGDASADVVEDAPFDKEIAAVHMRRVEHDDPDFSASSKPRKPFWITQKYQPILKVDPWGERDIVVVERDTFALPTDAAFEVALVKM